MPRGDNGRDLTQPFIETAPQDFSRQGRSALGGQGDISQNDPDPLALDAGSHSGLPRLSAGVQGPVKERVQALKQVGSDGQPGRIKLESLDEAAATRKNSIGLNR